MVRCPPKLTPMGQRKFYDGTLKPLMDKAEDGREVLLFLDASHFVMGCDCLGSSMEKRAVPPQSFSEVYRQGYPSYA